MLMTKLTLRRASHKPVFFLNDVLQFNYNVFGGHMSVFGATSTPVLDFR